VFGVADTGIGIAPELLANVFELFAQAETSLDRSQGGLGIGLTLVRSLVELHGGSVEARSEGLGRGSRFVVRLPPINVKRTSAARLSSVPAARPQLRVVLVEDNLDLLEMTKDLLELHGCTVRTASEGPTGLSLMLEEACDIAFIDIGLPGLDGLQLASRIRARGSDCPYLVAITGYGQDGDRSRALAAGFDEHIVKPVTIEVIQRTLAASQHREPHVMPNSR
jgi:CheY-like chemotaxis protein